VRDLAIVLLAAGGSARLGRPKQLLMYEGRSLLRRAAEAAVDAGCGRVVVVLGAQAEEMSGELANLGVEIVWNDGWERGIGTSIRAGVERALSRAGAPLAVMIMLCDQPLVTAGVLRRVVDAHVDSRAMVTAAEFDGTLGPPVIVDATMFPELLALPDDRGAKALWIARPEIVRRVACPEAGVDVDTPEDFERLSATARTEERQRAHGDQGK
jgi:molybdenum cofactor cytidylyltransferase